MRNKISHLICFGFLILGTNYPALVHGEWRSWGGLEGARSTVTDAEFFDCKLLGFDVNRDGFEDIVVYEDNFIRVHINRGDGSFHDYTTHPSNPFSNPLSFHRINDFVSGDLNNDGISDIITTNIGGQGGVMVGVFLGEDDGSFELSNHFGIVGQYLAVGDLNNDGNEDLVTGGFGRFSGSASYAWGNGDGTFSDLIVLPIHRTIKEFGIVDMNNDGNEDIISVNLFDNFVRVMHAGPSGPKLPGTDYPVVNRPITIASGDLNADGYPDMVVGSEQDSQVSVLINNGFGFFNEATTYTLPYGSIEIAVKDINEDTYPDIIAPGPAVLIGNGDGTFQESIAVTANGFARSLAVGKFDNTPGADVALTGCDTINVYSGNRDGTFGDYKSIVMDALPLQVISADLNNDTHVDLVTANELSISIFLGKAGTDFSTPTTINLGSEFINAVSGDFNGDNVMDLATANSNTTDISILLGNGDGSFASPVNIGVGPRPLGIAADYFNNDNILDLVTANNADDTIAVLFGNGNGTFNSPVYYPTKNDNDTTAGIGPENILTGDFNEDNIIDIISLNTVFKQQYGVLIRFFNSSLFLGVGDGRFQPFFYTNSSAVTESKSADLNNDGILDIASASGSRLRVDLGNGDGSFTQSSTIDLDFGSNLDYPLAIADFNRDNIQDIFIAGIIHPGLGDGTFAAPIQTSFRGSPRGYIGEDLDNDGWTDLVGITSNLSTAGPARPGAINLLRSLADNLPTSFSQYFIAY
jgi:hypothetical protein